MQREKKRENRREQKKADKEIAEMENEDDNEDQSVATDNEGSENKKEDELLLPLLIFISSQSHLSFPLLFFFCSGC